MIASGDGDKTIRLWQRDGTLITTLDMNDPKPYPILLGEGESISCLIT